MKKDTPSSRQPVVKPHHRKPYRKRHLSLLITSLLIAVLLGVQIGLIVGRNHTSVVAAPDSDPGRNSFTVVRSSYGYALAVDTNNFMVSATKLDSKGNAQTVPVGRLQQNDPLLSVVIKPHDGVVSRAEAAAQLSLQVNPDTAALSKAMAQSENAGLPPAQVAAQLFPMTGGSNFDIRVLSSTNDTINDAAVYKTVYQYTPKFNGGNSYAVVWTGVAGGRAFAIKLQGLVGASTTPAEFQPIFDSLTIKSDQAVLGAATSLFMPKAAADTKLDPKYLSDSVSPAVVKIYHIVCGAIVLEGQQLTDEDCAAFSGSGFLATENGYIATNGHVVVYDAKDALVEALISNPDNLQSFLENVVGMSAAQVQAVSQDSAALASIIAKIYDLPANELSLTGKQDLTLVALGTTAPQFNELNSPADLARYKRDTNNVKQATVVGYNYNAKDLYTAVANPSEGFSSSDVALLKINVQHAPTIPISTNKVIQNQKIIVMGFPGDADNSLTDNSKLSVSVTDGIISSIRKAAGDKGTLYQSDADASHGNSGGPALDDSGAVVGLLTYRIAGDDEGNAAKSYIRDIGDFTTLASDKNVKLNSASTTEDLWQQGLKKYSTNHFSAALKDFEQVKTAYPEHRLVGEYISSAQDAITAGKDVKDFPVAILIVGVVVALAGVAVAIRLILRHRLHHQLYQQHPPLPPSTSPIAAGFNQSAMPPPPAVPAPLPAQPAAPPAGVIMPHHQAPTVIAPNESAPHKHA